MRPVPVTLLVVALVLAVPAAAVLGVAWGRSRCGHHGDIGVAMWADTGGPEIADWYSYQHLPPGWAGHPDGHELPTDLVWALANPKLTSWQASHQVTEISAWRAAIAEDGQTEPFTIMLDPTGRARLSDGYRRLAACRQLQAPTVGVQFERVASLKGAPMLVEVILRYAKALGWRQ